MSTEVDRLVDTKSIGFTKKRDNPRGEQAVYTRLVVDLRPHKTVHERLRMCMSGNQMTRVMETTTRTVDLTTSKLHMNSVISTPGSEFAAGDAKDYYLNTPRKKKKVWKSAVEMYRS